jgi:hypothetical protein
VEVFLSSAFTFAVIIVGGCEWKNMGDGRMVISVFLS